MIFVIAAILLIAFICFWNKKEKYRSRRTKEENELRDYIDKININK